MNTLQKRELRTVVAVLLLCLAAVVVPASAQDNNRKNELNIGLGFANDFKLNWVENLIDIALTDELHENTDAMRHSGFFAGYKRHIDNRWAVGATVFYKSLERTRQTGEHRKKYSQDYWGLAVEGQYRYFQRGFFSLYGLAGGAVYTCKEDYEESQSDKQSLSEHRTHSPKWAFQLSPVGIQLGYNIGGKMEFGYGYKGIVSCEFFVKI